MVVSIRQIVICIINSTVIITTSMVDICLTCSCVVIKQSFPTHFNVLCLEMFMPTIDSLDMCWLIWELKDVNFISMLAWILCVTLLVDNEITLLSYNFQHHIHYPPMCSRILGRTGHYTWPTSWAEVSTMLQSRDQSITMAAWLTGIVNRDIEWYHIEQACKMHSTCHMKWNMVLKSFAIIWFCQTFV